MSNIHVTLNYLGYPITEEQVDLILKPATNPNVDETIRHSIDDFFGIKANLLNHETLLRYVKSSINDLYIAIMPHEHQIIVNILTPHKAAKRCFCIGEYLAAIELCAHVAEMLATLLNLIIPIKINGIEIDKKIEKNLFGREFSKLNQVHRLKILKAFNIIDDIKFKKFDTIREIRNKHFHLFGHDKTNIENDSYQCFSEITFLIKKILEIKINNNPPPDYTINSALKDFLIKNDSNAQI